MKKVSFDFDSTLSRTHVQDFARSLVNKGYEIWIVTSRFEDCDNYNFKTNNDDLFEVAKDVGIPKSQIQFMNMEDKYEFFLDKDFIFHLDDDWVEINMINSKTNTQGISCFGTSGWKNKCKKSLSI